MAAFVGFVSFWPEWRQRAREATTGAGVARLRGCFDLAVEVEAVSPVVAAGMILQLPAGAASDAPLVMPAAFPAPVALPDGVAFQLFPAKGGAVLVGIPDQEAWLTFSMAFLSQGAYRRAVSLPASAWHNAAVAELAALVLPTHQAEDVEGTCRTYGVPCVALRSASPWPALRHAAILPTWPALAVAIRGYGLTDGLRRAMPAAFLRDVLIEGAGLVPA